ncbi:MAG: sulfatase-like hydrolase/transferase [Bacteroidales bacterium]|nr:sulfatase-like hydrolase/transferase [Bacteroidales bacterium]
MDGHNTDTITSRSIDFITRNRKNPFLLVVAYDAIHDPLMERSKSIEKYRQKHDSNLPENNPVLAAMVERMDKAVGRIIKCIENNNLLSNTIIVFVSDNGGLENDASQAPLKHGKGWLYEGGIKVPLSVTWTGRIPKGKVSDEPVTSTDILPTLLDLSGITPPDTIDGISLAKLLTRNIAPQREAIYWHYPHYHNGPPAAAIRKGKYKLIEWYEKSLANQSGAFELYDLETDLSEATNLSQKLPLVTDSLRKDLNQWRISVKANLPTLNKAIH